MLEQRVVASTETCMKGAPGHWVVSQEMQRIKVLQVFILFFLCSEVYQILDMVAKLFPVTTNILDKGILEGAPKVNQINVFHVC